MVSALLSLAALPLMAQAINFPVDNKMRQEPGLLRYPITVNPGAPSKHHLQRRQQDVAIHAQQSGFFYSIELQVGTPPQSVSVNFDTGSAELWINPVCSKSTDPASCQSYGRFNGSQTYVDTNVTNRIKYGTGFAQLEYGYDYIQIGSAKISQQLFGVATDSEFAVTGIMGAGPQLKGWSSDYPMILDNMVTQKFIKSRVFSLDIRAIESARGSVVFGGVDTKKFSGSLEKRPIIPAASSPDKLTRYWIYLDGMTITKNDGSKAVIFDKVNGQPVLVDSGYTVSSLSTEYFNKIKDAFPGVTPPPSDDESGLYRVPCDVGKQNGTVDFKFGKTEINVPYNDFIWKQSADLCVLGVIPDDKFPVLGDTFLRAAYVVFDMDNRNVHVANNEDCGSSLLAVGSGPDAVPSVQGDCGKKAASTTSSTMPATTNTTTATTMTTTSASPTTVTSSMVSPGKNSTTISLSARSSMATTTSSTQPALTSSLTTPTNSAGRNASIAMNNSAAALKNGASGSSAINTSGAAPAVNSGSGDDSTTTNMSGAAPAVNTGSGDDSTTTKTSGAAPAVNTGSGDDSTTTKTSAAPMTTGTGTEGALASSSTAMESDCDDNSQAATQLAPTKQPDTTSKPFPTMARYNSTAAPTYTSAFVTHKLHTITSCPSSVTDCQVGAVITKTVVGYKTWCPAEDGKATTELSTTATPAITPKPIPTSQGDLNTSYYTKTKVHTITSCAGDGPCHKGKVTTEVKIETVYVCPETFGVFTFPLTHDCMRNETGCHPGDKVVNTYVVQMAPHPMADKPTPIPGCDKCIMPPAVQTSPPQAGTGPASLPAMTPLPVVSQTPAVPISVPTNVGTMNNATSTYTKPDGSYCPTCTPTSSISALPTAAASSFGISAAAGSLIMAMLAIAIL
ncbi:hypothetical protein E4U21_005045 [Claviceps maximensis]|nr:hypothetical protein E4U21_005045 [Claviceps maximensis]